MKPYEVIAATRGSALTPTQRHLLTHVAMRAGIDGECFASVHTLHLDSGLSERTIQGALRELSSLGVLRGRSAPGRSTTYTLHPEAIPRSSCTPAQVAPPQPLHPTPAVVADPPPQPLHPTPAAAAPDPIQEEILGSDPGEGATRASAPQLRLLAQDEAPTQVDATPKWARGHKGQRSIDVLGAVVRSLEAVRQRPVDPERCATDAKHVLALWRARGCPPLGDHASDIEAVAAWAREAPGVAENDIRGRRADGTTWGNDRSRSVSTLCRHDRFEDRLDMARRWASGAQVAADTRPAWMRVGGGPSAPDDDAPLYDLGDMES